MIKAHLHSLYFLQNLRCPSAVSPVRADFNCRGLKWFTSFKFDKFIASSVTFFRVERSIFPILRFVFSSGFSSLMITVSVTYFSIASLPQDEITLNSTSYLSPPCFSSMCLGNTKFLSLNLNLVRCSPILSPKLLAVSPTCNPAFNLSIH